MRFHVEALQAIEAFLDSENLISQNSWPTTMLIVEDAVAVKLDGYVTRWVMVTFCSGETNAQWADDDDLCDIADAQEGNY